MRNTNSNNHYKSKVSKEPAGTDLATSRKNLAKKIGQLLAKSWLRKQSKQEISIKAEKSKKEIWHNTNKRIRHRSSKKLFS